MTTVIDRLIPNLGPNVPVCASRVNIEQLDTIDELQDGDLLLAHDISEDVNKKFTANTVKFPVGYIFLSMVNTNPNTLLGYGTWTYLGQGKIELI